jgi:hypothetical protein
MAARSFHHVEGAHNIGIDIGAGVLKAVAHARLGREMHDNVGGEFIHRAVKRLGVFEHRLGGAKPLVLHEYRVATLLERNIVIRCHPIKAVHLHALV